jgi:hypothetical protein
MAELEAVAQEKGTPMPALPENGTRRQSLDELEQEVDKDPAKLILSPDHLVLALE